MGDKKKKIITILETHCQALRSDPDKEEKAARLFLTENLKCSRFCFYFALSSQDVLNTKWHILSSCKIKIQEKKIKRKKKRLKIKKIFKKKKIEDKENIQEKKTIFCFCSTFSSSFVSFLAILI